MDERRIEELTDEARGALDDGNYPLAVAITDQLVPVVPDDAEVREIRATAFLKSGAVEDGLDEARRAAELEPQSDRFQVLLALAAWQSDRLTLAQQSWERAIDLSDRRPGLLVDYAWFMAKERGPRLALQAANEAITANSKSSTAWAALGLAQFRLRRRRAAEASLTHALELDPNDPYAQWAMMALLHDQRKDKSAAALGRLLGDTPGTGPLVDETRREARKRQIEAKLIQRGAVREPTYDASPRLLWLWLSIAVIMVAGLIFLGFTLPEFALDIYLWGAILLVLLLLVRRLYD
jgi:tetratricopeptide (TPR) repeat protein